jgi:hypothetical protein
MAADLRTWLNGAHFSPCRRRLRRHEDRTHAHDLHLPDLRLPSESARGACGPAG